MGVLLVAIILSSISVVFAANSTASSTPKINSFAASAANISKGSSVTLKWDVSNAKKIYITGFETTEVKEFGLQTGSQLQVQPTVPTTYVLNAYDGNGSMVSATVDVNVDAKRQAKILSYTSTATQVKPNGSVILKWQVTNAKTAEVFGLEKLPEKLPEEDTSSEQGNQLTEGQYEAFPKNTTSYILQAVGYNGEVVSQAITISVVEGAVNIESFTVNPTEIILGHAATLSWKATNAAKVNITGIDGDFSTQDIVKVKPEITGTITYNLTATGVNGDKSTATATLVVKGISGDSDVVFNPSPNPQSSRHKWNFDNTTEKAALDTLGKSNGIISNAQWTQGV
jgi:hypothetical protein